MLLLEQELLIRLNSDLTRTSVNNILREQMQVIREELGDDFMSEAEELEEKIHSLNADKEVKEQLFKGTFKI